MGFSFIFRFEGFPYILLLYSHHNSFHKQCCFLLPPTLHIITNNRIYYLIFIVQFAAICIHQFITVCVGHFFIASQWTDIWTNRQLSMLFHHPNTVLSAALLSWLEHCTPFANTGTSWPRKLSFSLSPSAFPYSFSRSGEGFTNSYSDGESWICHLNNSNRDIKKKKRVLIALLEQTYLNQWHGLSIFKWQTWGK